MINMPVIQISVVQIRDKSTDLVGRGGREVDSRVPCFRVNAVSSIVFTGIFWCGLGQVLVDTLSVYF